MRSLKNNEIKIISGGNTAGDATAQVSEYYNDLEQSYKLCFAIGGATASLVGMMGLPATVSFGVFSLYAAYICTY